MTGAFSTPAGTSDAAGQVQTLPERSALSDADKWRLEDIYATNELWESDFATVSADIPKLKAYKGRLGESAAALLEFYQLNNAIGQTLGTLYVYAKMRKDEDTRVSLYVGMSDRMDGLATDFSAATAFVNPELLALPEDRIKDFLASNTELALYEHLLDDVLRTRAHVLSEKEEELLAMAGEVFASPGNIFSMLNNADITFPVIQDDEGNDVELTKGNFGVFLESPDRTVRKAAWDGLYGSYEKLANTIATSFSSQIKKDVMLAKVRKFETAREAALNANNIPLAVYDNLITAIHENLEPLRRYVRLRKKILGVDKIYHYDIYTPLFTAGDPEYTYDEGKQMVIEYLAPLGETYVTDMAAGLEDGWVDIYENQGKRSGAYQWGSYGTHPYLLLNYSDKLNDVFTLAHELGHAMHSFYTRKHQPYIYGDYTIFLAEVASVTNEAILMRNLIRNATDKQQKLVLLNRQLDNIVGTFYRQTMFAEFEMMVHRAVAEGKALTVDSLKEMYGDLYTTYYGDTYEVDDHLRMEWARIPHFYRNFYVFQYATGFAAGAALAVNILEGGQEARDQYLQYLSLGSSMYSIPQLKIAGVDMTSPKPIEDVARMMDELLSPKPIEDVARMMDELLDEVEATM